MMTLGSASAVMKKITNKAGKNETLIKKIRIGRILQLTTVKYQGKNMGGKVFGVQQYMQDFKTDREPVRMRSFYVLRKGNEFYPLSLGERCGKLFRFEEAVTGNSKFIPEKMKKLAAIAETWLPTIYKERI